MVYQERNCITTFSNEVNGSYFKIHFFLEKKFYSCIINANVIIESVIH